MERYSSHRKAYVVWNVPSILTLYLQTLNTESLGKVSNFSAVPGYGIQCVVSGIHMMVQSTNKQAFSSNHSIDGLVKGEGAENGTAGIEMQTFGESIIDSFYTLGHI